MDQKTTKEPVKPEFDADYGPNHPVNKEAAEAHGLRFNPRSGYYEDEDGFLIRDKFGQLL